MSLDLVRKNSDSPFQLQRSIVDQGGYGGAYESGGFDPSNVYNNDAANAAVESFGKIIGAGLSAITDEDANKADIKTKERLGKKETRLSEKRDKLTGMADVSKSVRLGNKIERINNKEVKVEKRIAEYNKAKNPIVTSTLTTSLNSTNNKTASGTKAQESKTSFDFNKTLSNSEIADKFKNIRLR